MEKNVHYDLFDDIKKYVPKSEIKEVFPEGIKETAFTDPAVITFLRYYYDSHLPVDVTAWVRVNKPSETLLYAKGFGTQVCFVRDTLYSIFYSYEEAEHNPVMVISTHISKSVRLPVYRIHLKEYNIEIILRYNFHNWIISIDSERPLDFDHMGLFDQTEVITHQYCEGFPKNKVYGCYQDDPTRFTIDITSQYDVYTFFYLLNNYLKNIDKK
ncbi:MAG: hypothetical protein IJ272_05275 [Clostridia bacterium]|nr:hypothetical protein [Clostridia bacterium]